MNNEELMHFGVLGMKWGVRRYQNYDGSYTQKGMEHYRQSRKVYDDAKAKVKEKKAERKAGRATRDDVKYAKGEVKIAERKLKRSYKQLKQDKLGDQGKQLYRQGKTIRGSEHLYKNAATVASGTAMTARILANNGYKKYAMYAGAVGAGITAVNAIFGMKNEYEAKRLRAYYGHSRPKNTISSQTKKVKPAHQNDISDIIPV